MSDFYEPDNLRVTTVREPECSNTSWIWIVLFIIALLAIIGLAIWIAWLYHSRTTGKNANTVEFKDPNIEVISNTALRGTWTSTTNKDDVVTLYATLHPPKFKPDGTLENTTVIPSKGVSEQTSVELSGLKPKLKYYATLIVTNSSSANYQVYTQLVYMDFQNPTPSTTSGTETVVNYFAIEDILQVGKLQLQSDNTNVRFDQKPLEGNSLWSIETNGQIKSKSNPDVCLYSNNGTLAAKSCADLLTENNGQTSIWSYNPLPYTNRWCLANSISTTDTTVIPSCMVLGTITGGEASVSVVNTSAPGDAWVNAFEVPS